MGKRTIASVSVSDVEKRRFPDKHYVYVISVRWSDGTSNVIYRRYSQFFELQTELIEKFPKESGKHDPEDRIIPFLPGKILFGRSNIRDVALERQPSIDEYCQKLMTVPARISECDLVTDFFEVTDEDIHPPAASDRRCAAAQITDPLQVESYVAIADYEKQTSQEVALQAGMAVDVIEKNETGWWLVSVEEEQGWVPSTYLERVDGAEDDNNIHSIPADESSYICTCEYAAGGEDEISLDRGARVSVRQKKLDGWWWVSYKDREGWAPATYLEKLESDRAEHFPKTSATEPAQAYPVQIVRNLFDVTNLSIQQPEQATGSQSKNTDSTEGKAVEPAVQKSLSDILKNKGSESSADKKENEIEMRPGKDERIQRHRRSSSSSNPRFSSQPPRRNTIVRKVPPKRPDPPKVKKEYYAIADFTDQSNDGLSFSAGQQVKLVEKNSSGWWYVEIDGNLGWVPASYIEQKTVPLAKAALKEPQKPQPCPQAAPATADARSSPAPPAAAGEGRPQPAPASDGRPRRHSRQGLGAPPPPPIDLAKKEQERKDSREEKKEICESKSIDDSASASEPKMFHINITFPKPNFGRKKSEDSDSKSNVLGRKKSDDTESSLFPKFGLKKDRSDSPKNDTESGAKSSVSNFASALKNVLNKSKPVPQKLPPKEPERPKEIDESIYEEIPHNGYFETWRAIADYEAVEDGEITIRAGQSVLVVEKTDTGWWLVELNNEQGWAPATYLEDPGEDLYEEINDDVPANSRREPMNKVPSRKGTMKESVAHWDGAEYYEEPGTDSVAMGTSEEAAFENAESVSDEVYESISSAPKASRLASELSRMMAIKRRPSCSDEAAEESPQEEEETAPIPQYAVSTKSRSNSKNSRSSTESCSNGILSSNDDPAEGTLQSKNSIEEVKRKLSPISKVQEAKVESKSKIEFKPKPEPKKFDKPKLESKPIRNSAMANKFLEETERRNSDDSEVSELMEARKKLISVIPKDDTKITVTTAGGSETTGTKSPNNAKFEKRSPRSDDEQVSKPRESVLAKAKLFSNEPKTHERPLTPPKPGLQVRRTSSPSDRPSTPPKPSKAQKPETSKPQKFQASKPSKPETSTKPGVTVGTDSNQNNKPVQKPSVSNLASKFEVKKPEVQKAPAKATTSGSGGDKNELSAILSKRRAHVDT